MAEFWLRNWQYLVSTALSTGIVLIGGGWTVHEHFEKRSDELSWKRTEFLFAQAQFVDTNPGIAQIFQILEGREPSWTIATLLSPESGTKAGRGPLLQQLDATLNVFDRLSYAVFDAKTLTPSEVSVFGWYLELIAEDSSLREYCTDNGFEDVLRLAKVVETYQNGREKAVKLPSQSN
jgi:hypothetical protein